MLFLSQKIENIRELENNIKELEETKNNIKKEIKELLMEKEKLNSEIKNRENLFVNHELIFIDTLSGIEFENYFATILLKLGYEASVTKASNDDGGDIIATKNNKRYVFQCKNYTDTVGNKAIQEVYTAKGIYKCDEAVVITNNYYTKSAKKEAEILSVMLWDRDILIKLLFQAFEFDINNIDNTRYFNRFLSKGSSSNTDNEDNEEEIDILLNDAIELCIETQQASTSFIQRRLKIGYARAEKIVEQMEERGIISGYQGSKPREVLMSKEKWQELKNS